MLFFRLLRLGIAVPPYFLINLRHKTIPVAVSISIAGIATISFFLILKASFLICIYIIILTRVLFFSIEVMVHTGFVVVGDGGRSVV